MSPARASVLLSFLITLMAGAHCGDGAVVKSAGEVLREDACARDVEAGDVTRALANCGLCLEFNDKNPQCLNSMGMVFLYKHDNARARSYFTHALREYADYGQARTNLGKLALEDGDLDEAERMFTSAIEIDPHYVPPREGLAVVHIQRGERVRLAGGDPRPLYDEAEDEARKLFEIAPARPAAYWMLGVVDSFRGQYLAATDVARAQAFGDAEAFYRHCTELDARNVDCLGSLAHLFVFIGPARANDAVTAAHACLAVDPGNPICGADLATAASQAALTAAALGAAP